MKIIGYAIRIDGEVTRSVSEVTAEQEEQLSGGASKSLEKWT